MVIHTDSFTFIELKLSASALLIPSLYAHPLLIIMVGFLLFVCLQPSSVMAFPATTPTGMMGYGMVSISEYESEITFWMLLKYIKYIETRLNYDK